MDNLLIAEAAEEEYTDSLRWYAQRSRRAAEGFEAEFEQALESIAAHPERYPLCDDRHRFFRQKPWASAMRPNLGIRLTTHRGSATVRNQPGTRSRPVRDEFRYGSGGCLARTLPSSHDAAAAGRNSWPPSKTVTRTGPA